MATGRLGAVDLVAATDTLLYTVPASTRATVSISMCNRNASVAAFRIAAVDGLLVALADEDYIEYDSSVAQNGVLERTGIALAAGESIVVRSDLASVSAVLWGFEEAA